MLMNSYHKSLSKYSNIIRIFLLSIIFKFKHLYIQKESWKILFISSANFFDFVFINNSSNAETVAPKQIKYDVIIIPALKYNSGKQYDFSD